MYWENLSKQAWTEQIRYYCNNHNHLTVNELRDAFIHLAQLYTADFCNLKLLEEHIVQEFGEEYLEDIVINSREGRIVSSIEFNDGNLADIQGVALKLCDYIDNTWFNGKTNL